MDQVAPEFFIEEKERREAEARGADRERSRIHGKGLFLTHVDFLPGAG
jgi:hypothetical protein